MTEIMKQDEAKMAELAVQTKAKIVTITGQNECYAARLIQLKIADGHHNDLPCKIASELVKCTQS